MGCGGASAGEACASSRRGRPLVGRAVLGV